MGADNRNKKAQPSKPEAQAPHLPKKVILTGEQRADNARYRQAQRASKSVFGRWKRTARHYGGEASKTEFCNLVKQYRQVMGPEASQSDAVFG